MKFWSPSRSKIKLILLRMRLRKLERAVAGPFDLKKSRNIDALLVEAEDLSTR